MIFLPKPSPKSKGQTMPSFEVHFRPAKRKVAGVHQPDVSYIIQAINEADATAMGRRMAATDHPGYLHTRTTKERADA